MDFNLNEEQKQYLDTVRRFVGREVSSRILSLEKGHTFPFDIIRKAWELGILNLSIPESVKGYSIDLISTALIIRELAYGDSGIATSAMCNDLANAVVAMHGTPEQQQAFLGPFMERPLLASFCLTEPMAGSDNSSMTSCIRKGKNGKYLLNGTKCFITNASFASQFTVFCKVGKPSSPFIACVVVPAFAIEPDMADPDSVACREIPLPCGGRIVTGKPEDKLGQRLSNTAAVTFEDVEIGDDQIIGDRRLGFQYLTDVLDYARPMVAAIGVGLARRALDVTLAYTRDRRQFGERICDLPVARETLVAMWKKTEQAEMALMKAAFMVQQGAPDRSVYASLAKNLAAEAAVFCTTEGLHLHGGYGFMAEYEISKLIRDAQIIDIYEGVREVQNMIIGRELV
ncbi:MAG: acyl-CoA/acyl-ACP dehydrogenase [Deltaproteobacteria bacterium]|nr:acyl-CoA/acyl-ACP dehydrogenase [Deltaproteobacteria bacterium]